MVGINVGMARSYSDLTARKLIREHRAACDAGERAGTTKYSWGNGLVLAVGPSGNASWIARITAPGGKRRDIGVGKFGEVSIEEARAAVQEHRRTAREGHDPKAVKDARKHAERNPVPTFEDAAKSVHGERKGSYRNVKHRDQWINSLQNYAFPIVGKVSVDEIDVPAVTRVLRPIWLKKPETARRVLQRIASVVAWSVGEGHRDHELPVKAIRMGLGGHSTKQANFAAVPVEDAPTVFAALIAKDSLSARCLAFTVLTAARSAEARGARWPELDMEARTWTIPPERTKTQQEHVVPLSALAIEQLKAMPVIANDDELIFPSSKGKPLTDVALSKALAAVVDGATVHGWRSTFRDWSAERTNVQNEVAEAALAHVVSNRVEAAYRRTKFLEKRRPLMEAWAEYLTGAAADVVDLNEARRLKKSSG